MSDAGRARDTTLAWTVVDRFVLLLHREVRNLPWTSSRCCRQMLSPAKGRRAAPAMSPPVTRSEPWSR
jgi:hypothetical protein